MLGLKLFKIHKISLLLRSNLPEIESSVKSFVATVIASASMKRKKSRKGGDTHTERLKARKSCYFSPLADIQNQAQYLVKHSYRRLYCSLLYQYL